MKTYFIFCVVMLIALNQCAYAQNKNSSPKALVKHVFKAFKNGDFAAYESLILKESDCAIIINNSEMPDSLKSNAMKVMTSTVRKTRMNAHEDFCKILEWGKKLGIDWNKIKLNKIEYKKYERNAVEFADIFAYCKFKDKVFTIDIRQCYKSNEWLMMYDIIVFYIGED